MTLHKFYQKAYARMRSRKERLGQALFNVLATEHPELARLVQVTELDPFYRPDHDLTAFQAWLAENWEKK